MYRNEQETISNFGNYSTRNVVTILDRNGQTISNIQTFEDHFYDPSKSRSSMTKPQERDGNSREAPQQPKESEELVFSTSDVVYTIEPRKPFYTSVWFWIYFITSAVVIITSLTVVVLLVYPLLLDKVVALKVPINATSENDPQATSEASSSTIISSEGPSTPTVIKIETTNTTRTVTTTTVTALFDSPYIKVNELKNLFRVNNNTNHLEIQSTSTDIYNNNDKSWSWSIAPPIQGKMHLTVNNNYGDEFKELPQIIKWLAASIVSLDIDASFAKEHCSNVATSFNYGPTDHLLLPRVYKMEIRNLNKCFMERWVKNLKLPELKEVQVFGTDKLVNYRTHIIALYKNSSKLKKIETCDEDCRSQIKMN